MTRREEWWMDMNYLHELENDGVVKSVGVCRLVVGHAGNKT